MRVTPSSAHQIAGATALDYAATFHHQHFVEPIFESSEPVRDEQHRASGHKTIDGFEDGALGLRIEVLGGFIEQQNGGVLQQRPRDGDASRLSARQPYARLADVSVITVRRVRR